MMHSKDKNFSYVDEVSIFLFPKMSVAAIVSLPTFKIPQSEMEKTKTQCIKVQSVGEGGSLSTG